MQQPIVEMRLELSQERDTLIGSVNVDGAPPRRFTGWMGLNGAIDAAFVGAQQQPAAERTTMRTIIILHEVDDLDRWKQSTGRAAEFERVGAKIREFTGPAGSNQIGLIVEVSDDAAFQALLQSDEAAAAMKADGVRPETLIILDEHDA